jgi:glycosyltransferase involved in cell wall biosynthesis
VKHNPEYEPGLVSVVVPAYNAAGTIRESIQSACEQSYARIETIVVDDGSSDHTSRIVSSFGDSIRLERFAANQGVSQARNRGTELARGEYLQYLDADDLLAFDTIRARVSALENSGADVACVDWQRFGAENRATAVGPETFEPLLEPWSEDMQAACATSFWAPPAALMYKREIVNAIGGWNRSLPVIQDARFLFDAAYHGATFVHVRGVGAYYRVGSGKSLSTRGDSAFAADVLRNADQIRSLWERSGEMTELRRKALCDIYDFAARSLFTHGSHQFKRAVNGLNEMSRGEKYFYSNIANAMADAVGIRLARRIMCVLQSVKRSAV